MPELGVHQTHCCVLHGCKYGEDETCPVVNGEIEQTYLCEDCGEEGIETLMDLAAAITKGWDEKFKTETLEDLSVSFTKTW